MSFYQLNLALFATGNAYLLYRQYARDKKPAAIPIPQSAEEADASPDRDVELENHDANGSVAASKEAVRKFQWDFFLVYALAVAADWLQGPHIYAIYKYEKEIPEKIVAALYAAGFISGAISASFAGELADRYGRRLACLVYCGSYVVTCATMFSDDLAVLFVGRLCGGVSTTLLFSVFEAWMITEYHSRGLAASELKLSSVFGYMTTLSCVVAIVSGVVGDMLVSYMGWRVWPFVASIVCSLAAAWCIMRTWRENFGTKSITPNTLRDVRAGITTILSDSRIFSLGITSCFFEGAMYLFIFFWSAALKSARVHTGGPLADEDLPYGLIFSCFMCAMMGGSAFFSLFSANHNRESAAYVLMSVTLLASACLSAAVVLENEMAVFWALCAIEASIGAYFPSMALLKSEVVEDGVRGRVYSILRFPLNVFVVVVHSLDQEGDEHRNRVFMTLAALLMVAFFVVKRNLGPAK
ncbi:Major facilitator superfamily transporter [Coniochaeta hoffmannii]|uniref:Molybdate-anion transporter n=1 Tax=Coniochaeta hoffmannii TaxID=91930 RepID=A0AA38VBQ6_9PEZI|nr:Major facilitator superfamily transporter [Coniochaeta hoffmannii]